MTVVDAAGQEVDGAPARWWHAREDGRVECDLCPRGCKLRPGQRGMCYVRQNVDGALVLTTYGRSSGFCVDPIEKKPLYHFYPGSSVFSFGTAGCNLGCQYCINWDISKAKGMDALCDEASPTAIAETAAGLGCRSVAFTYNDPIVFAEYALDTAAECRRRGLATVAVTNGFLSPGARPEFFAGMDAANIDLKGFSERFYEKLCLAKLGPVLDTLRYVVHETDTWLEITNLMIPGWNDDPDEVRQLCRWVHDELGPDVPIHFTAFSPHFRMLDVPPTPLSTLERARGQALETGLRYVYTGNVVHLEGGRTRCPGCGAVAVERDSWTITRYAVQDGRCARCEAVIPGRFGAAAGTWGPRRMPVRMGA